MSRRGEFNSPLEVTEQAWMSEAACKGADTEMFYPGKGENDKMKAAKAVCMTCGVRLECLDYAVDELGRDEPGIWGGMTQKQRRILISRRNRGYRDDVA